MKNAVCSDLRSWWPPSSLASARSRCTPPPPQGLAVLHLTLKFCMCFGVLCFSAVSSTFQQDDVKNVDGSGSLDAIWLWPISPVVAAVSARVRPTLSSKPWPEAIFSVLAALPVLAVLTVINVRAELAVLVVLSVLTALAV